MSHALDHAVDTVAADLHYITPTGERPRTYTFEPPPGVPRSTAVYAPHRMEIRNFRPFAGDVSLDVEGFALVHHRSAMKDFYDEAEIRAVYYPEAEQLLGRLTGGGRVLVFDHTIRRRIPGSEDRTAGAPRQPVPRVHVDHTEKSGPQRVRDLLPEEAETLLKGRVQIINLWRPIRGPLLDAPLAVADARSVRPEQLIASDLVYPDRAGETYAVAFDPAHHWYYAPAMGSDEALLLKCYDSKTDGRARFAPHTAFEDPNTPSNAPPRESIELRTLVFHPA
jgi:hypothetical protein